MTAFGNSVDRIFSILSLNSKIFNSESKEEFSHEIVYPASAPTASRKKGVVDVAIEEMDVPGVGDFYARDMPLF